MLRQEIEGAFHAGQHAERETIHLHHAQGVDIVFVPLNDLPSSHRRGLDRHEIVEPLARQNETARMLAEMARRADQRARQLEREAQAPVAEIHVEVGGVLVLDAGP